MPTKIFISCWPGDEEERAMGLRLSHRLAAFFDLRGIFIEDIVPYPRFDPYPRIDSYPRIEALEAALSNTDLLLVLIGPSWLDRLRERKLDHYVIARALQRKIVVLMTRRCRFPTPCLKTSAS
jgi:hypothetical protein